MGATLEISANPPSIPARGGVAAITVFGFRGAEDGGGVLPDGTQVFLRATVGVIESQVETVNGIARARLQSDGRSGTATITATSGSAAPATLDVRIGADTIIILTANPPRPASPGFTSQIVAAVFDENNNLVVDAPVQFSTTEGSLASGGNVLRTNASGMATDRLSLGAAISAVVTATSGSATATITVAREGVVLPSVSSVNPNSAEPGDTLDVSITGSNFDMGATVSFGGGITVADVVVDAGGTGINATVTVSAGAVAGSRTVSVTNPGGATGTLDGGFTVQGMVLPPTITRVSPPSAGQDSTTIVTISGANFQSGATVDFGGDGVSVTVSSIAATSIRVTVGVSDVAVGGLRNVTVTNPDGMRATSTGGFRVDAVPLMLTSVQPTSGARDQTLSVEILGSGFQIGASVDFGDDILIESLEVSTGSLKFDITIDAAATPGARDIIVTNGDNEMMTLANAFTVN